MSTTQTRTPKAPARVEATDSTPHARLASACRSLGLTAGEKAVLKAVGTLLAEMQVESRARFARLEKLVLDRTS
jgi:hypothetical protein